MGQAPARRDIRLLGGQHGAQATEALSSRRMDLDPRQGWGRTELARPGQVTGSESPGRGAAGLLVVGLRSGKGWAKVAPVYSGDGPQVPA